VPVDFTPITPSYQELQILERTKYWVTVLGSVFKVNPSYAGFDFENTNRATDTSQQEAYAQRGFRVLLRQLEESINRGLIWSDISEDLKFEFEREQTVAERKDRADLIESQANAARAIAGAVDEDADDPDGKVQYRDGRIVVEDGTVVPEDDGGDAGGGLFMSTDDAGDVTKQIPEAVLSEISEDRFVPPKGAKEACERALELIDEHGRETASGGTQEALQRARQIIRHYEDDEPLIGTNDDGVPYVVEIANFHRRHRAQGNHEFDADDHDHRYEDNGWLSDQLWGSDAGFEWSDSLADRIDEVRETLSLSTEWDLYEPADGGDTGNGDGGDGPTDGTDGTVVLSDAELVEFDRHLLTAHKDQIQPASVDDIEKRTWNRDDVVPEYVRDAVNEAVDRGAVFERFESVPTDLRDRVEDIVQESLTQPQGWSLDSIVDRMQDVFPGADADDLETVARTETTSVLNRSREIGYQDRDDSDRFVYYWQGPGDSRTTALCEDLKIATGQESGTPDTDFDFVPGEPVDMKTLVRLEREASENHFPNLQYRRHTPHINCRHTFVRDTTADTDIDVTVPDAEVFNSVGKCGCVDDDAGESYRDTVSKLADDLARSDRERQIERALGESIVQALRTAFTESGGSVEPAKRHLNNRLTRSSSYDDDEHGLVSKPTLYNWKRKYDDRLNDVL